MKAISLLQPWATLVVIGSKKYETRSWNTQYRGPLLIHASAKQPNNYQAFTYKKDPFFSKFITDVNDLPYGAIIGKVELIRTCHTGELLHPNMFEKEKEITDQEKAFGDYTPGRYAWELANPIEFEKPIPYKGSLSIWEFPDALISGVKMH